MWSLEKIRFKINFWRIFKKSCQKRSRPFKRKNEFQPEGCLTEVKIKKLFHIRVRRGQKPPSTKNQPIWSPSTKNQPQSVGQIVGVETRKTEFFSYFWAKKSKSKSFSIKFVPKKPYDGSNRMSHRATERDSNSIFGDVSKVRNKLLNVLYIIQIHLKRI